MTFYPDVVPHPPPPGNRPELPEGIDPAPRWPAWYAPIALLCGILATFMALLIIGIVARVAGAPLNTSSSGVTVAFTLVQDAVFVGIAVLFASMSGRPRPWQFGLRGAPFWRTAGWAAVALVMFYVLSAIYALAFNPHGKQTVTQDLGANKSALALTLGAFVVIVVAPMAEELFFRGFFFRALRSRFNLPVAALIDGLFFGAIHYTGPSTLSVLPILALLGFIFCLLYERTGTLFATIALHSINNTVAYGSDTHNGWRVSLIFGAAMLAAAAVAIFRTPRRAALPAP